MPKRLQPLADLGLQDLADVDLGDADVAVRVALDVLERCEILRVEVEHHAFGDDRDAVAPAVAEPLDDGAGQRVDDGLEADGLRELLAG